MSRETVNVLLFGVILLCLCLLTIARDTAQWVLAEYGLSAMLAGIGVYALIAFGSVWLVNRINRPFVPPSDGLSGFQYQMEPGFNPSDAYHAPPPVFEPENNLVLGSSEHAKVLSMIEASAKNAGRKTPSSGQAQDSD